MRYYTIYTSKPTAEISKKVVDEITAESIKWNKDHGITGILLCMENRFFQFLEGNEKDVTEVFEMIRKDPRHTDVIVRVKGYSNERVFSEWSMGSWMLSNEELNSLSALKDLQVYLNDPVNTNLQSKNLVSMMHDIMKTWIEHEPERAKRLKG